MNKKSNFIAAGITVVLLTTGSAFAEISSGGIQGVSKGVIQEVSVGGIQGASEGDIQEISQSGRPLLKKWWDQIREISSGG